MNPLLRALRGSLFLLFPLLLSSPPAQAQGESDQNPHHARPNYRFGAENWQAATPPDPAGLRYSVFLIGDVGKPILPDKGGEPSLNFLRRQILQTGNRSTTVYLGDNIYNQGMPPEGAYDRKDSEARINAQLDIFKGYRGEKYMIPGNHDWVQGAPKGLAQVIREQTYTEEYLAKDSANFAQTGDFLVPRDGCPGPYEVRIQDNVVLIALNSQWFLTSPALRPFGASCGVETEAEVYAQLEDIIARNQDKNIMVVGHHPLFSDGIHGGYFTVGDHLFPLSIVSKYAFLPLPIIGSIYPLARKYGGINQDLPHPDYQAYKSGLVDIFNKYPNVIYACGHEHNLQYFKQGQAHYIVSGSGCKTQHVRPGDGGGAVFSDKEKGFVRVNYYDNGQVWQEHYIPEGSGETARLVFRNQLYTKQTTAAAANEPAAPRTPVEKEEQREKAEARAAKNQPLVVPVSRPDFKDSTVTVAINPLYNERSGFHNWLLGKHYRAEWATPVPFPVLDLATAKDGLTPYKTGGGKQTLSLKLRNEEGRNYSLRGIDKDPAAVLPANLRTGLARDVLQDQVSAQHPFASFVLPPLAQAAGILHPNPEYVYIPKDPLLGQYEKQFANRPAGLEEDAKDDQSDVASLGFAKNIVGTERMLERLLEDNDNRVNQVAFARSRLFDMWIGDWDRHEDQWRWAERKTKDGDRVYTAIPEDRDIAFFKGDGVLPYLISRKFAIRNFQNFGYDYADYKGLNQTGLSNDRVFMANVSRAQWVEQAETMKKQLTDEVIKQAFRDKWPKAIMALHGAEIIAKLKSRRDLLPELAARYADVVADIVEVRGSEKNEKFIVDRLPDGNTHVVVRKITKEGRLSKTLYDRVLDGKVTSELRLYGIAGQDVFDVRGAAKDAIRLRIIGGTGRDSITDVSRVGGLGRRTQIYDADSGNVIRGGREARLRLEPGTEVSRYDHPKRFDLKDYRLNYTGPNLFFGYNIDDGALVGGGVTHRRYGFRREPFASEQSLSANLAPAREAYNVRYLGQFNRVLGKTNLRVAAQYYGPQLLYNFFGIGNNTQNLANQDEEADRPTPRTINNAYRVRFSRLEIAPTFERQLFSPLRFGIGPRFERIHIYEQGLGSELLAVRRRSNEESRRFGFRETDFEDNSYLGAITYLSLDASSSRVNPRIGLRWYNEAQYNKGLSHEHLAYGRLSSELRFYLTPNFPFRLTYAGRLGVQRNLGDYRFYQANTLGGTTNLRGYRRTRFAGRTALYTNFEARLQLLQFNAYLFPGTLGVLGLADAGRVYAGANDTRTGLSAFHTGFGGGVYVDILKQAVINVTYSVGEEELVFIGFDFLF
ncbi:metallophosphoesterase [uncultured Hymenobacter sp.]|uniref:metallophosphoesterase n=1 Tax=uncultured Hymenobacter sp. TaxID=170016 RepID=UPI0035C97C7D